MVTAVDYLLLLVAVTGQSPSSMHPEGTSSCMDLNGDCYVDLNDLLRYEAGKIGALSLCRETSDSATSGGGVLAEGAAAGAPQPAFGGDALVIGGKRRALQFGWPEDQIYVLDLGEATLTRYNPPSDPNGQQPLWGNGRVTVDSLGRIHQIHASAGLVRWGEPGVVVPPDTIPSEVGDLSVEVEIGPLFDASFDSDDPNIVTVAPVQVRGGGLSYRAAARLRLAPTNPAAPYEVLSVYGPDPNELFSPEILVEPGGSAVSSPDYDHLGEVEVDAWGNVYVLSVQELNNNDWLLIYAGATATPVLLSNDVESPSSLTVSRHDASKLYVSSGVLDASCERTRIRRFEIVRDGSYRATGLTELESDVHFQEVIEIVGMRRITSITEDPSDGTLYVLGMTCEAFDVSDPPPNPAAGVFTQSKLAVIGPDVAWSGTSPFPTVESRTIAEDSDLALPLSGVFVPEESLVGHALSLTVINGDYGEVSPEPELSRYPSGTVVRLLAAANEGGQFHRWRLYDPNFPGDGNHARPDTNSVLRLVMTHDVEVEAVFGCAVNVTLMPLILTACVLAGLRYRRTRR
jgi:hypothetical protein